MSNTRFINIFKLLSQKKISNYMYLVQYYKHYINFRRVSEYYTFFNQINLLIDVFKEKSE